MKRTDRALSIHGTDCLIDEPHHFSPQYYIHKFKASGLRYEVDVGFLTGK